MFEYDDSSHKYTVDGIEYPGVTSLLKPLSDYDKVPEFMLERKRILGQAVHNEVKEYLLEYPGGTITRDPIVQGYMIGFFKFEEEHPSFFADQSRLVIEKPMAHKKLKYAGTPDLIIDALATIDIKTRGYNKIIDPLQLESYENLHLDNGGTKVKGGYPKFILELRHDGTYKLVVAKHAQAWARFRYLLDRYWREVEYWQKVEIWKK